jgi:predicted oxidoreductase
VHFDTADCYGEGGDFGGAERLLGEIARRAPSLLAGAEIATKIGVAFGSPYNSSPDYIAGAIEASLARLGVERVDLLYIHRPDLLAHPAETAAALDRAVEAGKARAIGVSNFTVAQLRALARYLKAPLVAHQIEFSPLCVDPLFDGALDYAMEAGHVPFAWSPLGGGRLLSGDDAQAARVREALAAAGEALGLSLAGTAVAFLLSHPAGVRPILGTRNTENLKDAVAGAAARLGRPEWYRIVEAARGARLP